MIPGRRAGMAIVLALASCRRSSAPTAKVEPPAIQAPAAQVAADPQPAASPSAPADRTTAERWAALGVGTETPAAPAAGSAFPVPPPVVASMEPPPAPTPEGPSETQALQEKIERHRGEYRAAKEKVDSLERQVKELTELASGMFADGNSASATTQADLVRARLGRARGDLESARQELAAVEERARRDGVGYGQLY